MSDDMDQFQTVNGGRFERAGRHIYIPISLLSTYKALEKVFFSAGKEKFSSNSVRGQHLLRILPV